jgi:FHS family glucose/mannose:H+ symporter-like MFS transporter
VSSHPANAPRTTPPLWALHILFLMTGTGTTLLGPILPLLMRTWHLHDAQAGVLLAAQFLGAFAGGISVGSHARRELLTASAASILGFIVLALAASHTGGMPAALLALPVAGFGIGHMIAANNIIGGRLPEDRRARTLTLLNLSWSLGAILSPVLAAWLLPAVPLRTLLGCFAALFACAGVAVYARIESPPPVTEAAAAGSPRSVVLFFGTMLLLYGGVETCMNGWLTTYILRYGGHSLRGSQLSTSLFWIALIAGRGLTAGALSYISERGLLRLALGATTLFIGCLLRAQGALALTACAVLLGLSMAPFFPVCFSILMGHAPRARQAGLVIAVSGIGAALFPWLTGRISTWSGSLHTGLIVPLLAAATLLAMSLALPRLRTAPST